MSEKDTRTHRALAVGFALGTGLSLLLFTWFATGGTFNPTEQTTVSGGVPSFYDGQARALLHGHMDVPVEVIGYEAIEHDGRLYGYWGITPALIRAPLVLLTGDLHPGLNAAYMVLAFGLLALYAFRVLRRAIDGPAGRASPSGFPRGLWTSFFLALGMLGGSIVLFLGGLPLPYHESIMWGAAFGLASIFHLVRFIDVSSRRHLALAILAATLSMNAKVTIGAGAVLALVSVLAVGLVCSLDAIPLARARRRVGEFLGLDRVVRALGAKALTAALLIALVVPAGSYVLVNVARFGSPTSVPLERHSSLAGDLDRLARYYRNGAAVNPRFIPTNAVQFLRPDGVRWIDSFPWVDFAVPAHASVINVGGVEFDGVEPVGSIPSLMPGLLALGLGGGVALCSKRRGAALGAFRIPALATVVASVTTLSAIGVSNRYIGDLVPGMFVLASVGSAALLFEPIRRARFRRLLEAMRLTGVASVVVVAVFINFSTTLIYQRRTSDWIRPEFKLEFARVQQRVDRWIDGGQPRSVRDLRDFGAAGAKVDDVVTLGNGSRWRFNGEAWERQTRGPLATEYRLRVAPGRPPVVIARIDHVLSRHAAIPRPRPPELSALLRQVSALRELLTAEMLREPILVRGESGAADGLFLEWISTASARLVLDHWGSPVVTSAPFSVSMGRSFDLIVSLDAGHDEVYAQVDERVVLIGPASLFNGRRLAIGEDPLGMPGTSRFGGHVILTARPRAPPLERSRSVADAPQHSVTTEAS